MSESFYDLGYTRPEDKQRYDRQRAATHPTTSAQKNQRAHRIEEQHLHAKEQPMLEPTSAQLDAMTPGQRADTLRGVRSAKIALQASLGVTNPELVERTELEVPIDTPVQGELPFNS